MRQRMIVFSFCVYLVNIALLFAWPFYASFWASFACSLVGAGAASNTLWATAEALRLVVVIAVGGGLARWWSEREQAVATEEAEDDVHVEIVRRVVADLGSADDRHRVGMLKTASRTLPSHLTTDEAAALLGRLRDRERVQGIKLLRRKLAPAAEFAPLLNGLDDDERDEAMKVLYRPWWRIW